MVTGSTLWKIEEYVSKTGKNMGPTVVRTLGMKPWRWVGEKGKRPDDAGTTGQVSHFYFIRVFIHGWEGWKGCGELT